MKVTRLYSGEDGLSHFEDLSFNLKKAKVSLSAPKTIILSEVEAGHEYSWHNAPRKQWVLTLLGEIQVEIGNGEKRRFGPGDLLFAEDTTGHGHVTMVVSTQPWRCMYLPTDECGKTLNSHQRGS